MNKQALLNIDPVTTARFGLGGLAAGGGAAALLNLIHNAKVLREERAARKHQDEPDENTIVLTLPRKTAEVAASKNEPTKIKVHEGSKVVSRLIKDQNKKQARHYTGEFGEKMAAKGWPTLTAASLAALGGGTLGAAVVDKIYQNQREKQLQAELEQAKKEYMDTLVGGQKRAEALEALFPTFDLEKQAQDSSFGVISYPMAAAAILTILGAGGTGYLTKKILDTKMQEAEEQGRDIPKVKRIVFRTQQPNEAAPPLPPAEANAVKAAFALMLDYVAGRTDYVAATDVVAAIKEAGTTADELLTKVATDADDTVGFLKQHPKLVDSVTGHLFRDNRMKRFMAQTGPGRAYAIHRVGKLVNKLSPAPVIKSAQASGAGGGSGGVGGNAMSSPKRIPTRKRVRLTPPWMKSAQDIPIGGLAGKALGTLVKSDTSEPTSAGIAKDIVDQQHQEQTKRMLSKLKMRDTVQLQADDPAAARYLNANQKRIVGLVKQLAKEGTL